MLNVKSAKEDLHECHSNELYSGPPMTVDEQIDCLNQLAIPKSNLNVQVTCQLSPTATAIQFFENESQNGLEISEEPKQPYSESKIYVNSSTRVTYNICD